MAQKQSVRAVDVRSQLCRALVVDLVGPGPEDEYAAEVLRQSPSRWYLTGFLAPLGAAEEQRTDETNEEEVDEPGEKGGTDDANPPDPRSARRAHFASSIGMSFLVGSATKKLVVKVDWGEYRAEDATASTDADAGDGEERARGVRWRRTPRSAETPIVLPAATTTPDEADVPGGEGLKVVLAVRPVGAENGLPPNTRSVSVFVVNKRPPAADAVKDEAFAFQVALEVELAEPLVPRPNIRGLESSDWDERVADLQYRDDFEYAVGHGVATEAVIGEDRTCRRVRTCWIPGAEVERVAPSPIEGAEFCMETLAELASGEDARDKLGGMVSAYRSWIDGQVALVPSAPRARKETGDELLSRARTAADRIEAGIDLLNDALAREAFRIANRVMAVSARRRVAREKGKEPHEVDPPAWRPFQLAFILMNLPGLEGKHHNDRDIVDLLFFPTGGGKTEAYLGLAAFTLVLRRLRNPGIASAGLTVLMRYTLRLLTLDQLGRAAALICALELERQKDPAKLGNWPFEIGLWVGRAATPNRMGQKGDGDSYSARAKTIAFKNDDRKPSPIPLEECPWCGEKFKRNSFQLLPNPDRPLDLRVLCVNRKCDFTRNRPLPILAVDEPVYRRLPCFLVATVDKFAAMPWTGQVGGFFGRVQRYDENGFYGPCDPGHGAPLPEPLPPPDLIIQDELHLISGPMGTMVGLYETALDGLSARGEGKDRVRPKIIASTATVRRAESQIRALFCRRVVDIFPPPGPDRRDSFFAATHSPAESNARLYLGIAAQGRSLKVLLLRTYLVLLGATQKAYKQAGGKRNKQNPADPYMTLLGYFNSLRELGGSRRIVEDEVTTRLSGYSSRKRIGELEGLFADRRISYEVVELTSRVGTDKVAEARRRLALPFHENGRVDVAIATNMISVGLDISRLGLMVVLGQPKTSAEYIQATSRVGRDHERPGLVVTLLNIHRPRDRSHYERFAAYHESFYRNVEATSVTPFSPRALDRGLAGTLVALARQGNPTMTPPVGAAEIVNERANLHVFVEQLTERAREHAALSSEEADRLGEKVRQRAEDLLDEWGQIAQDYLSRGTGLQYQREVGAAQRLLYEFLHPDLKLLPRRHWKFRANRSMRDVEPNVNLWMKTLDGIDLEVEEQ